MLELSRFWFQFWKQFGTAYPEGNVPENTTFPFITYPVARTPWGDRTIIGINIYDQSTSFSRLRELGLAIENAIPQSGVTYELENGKGTITLFRGNPFIQSRSLPDEEVKNNIKADYVSIEVLGFMI